MVSGLLSVSARWIACVGTPEVVVVLGLPAGEHRVRRRDVDVAEHPGRLAQVEAAGERQLAQRPVELLVGLLGVEHDRLGLERAPEAAVQPPVLGQLSDILGVALARQLDRRPWSVVRRRRVGERSHERQLRIDRRCRRDRLEHARPRRLLDVDVRVVVAVTDPHRDHPGCRGCTDCLAAVLGEPVRDRRHERVVGGLHRSCLCGQLGDEDVPCRLRNSGIRRSTRWRGDPGRERLQPAFDRGDSVVHRAMHHRAEHARACGRSADHDHARGDAAPVDDGVLGRRGSGCCRRR